jgi:hypothetical protein
VSKTQPFSFPEFVSLGVHPGAANPVQAGEDGSWLMQSAQSKTLATLLKWRYSAAVINHKTVAHWRGEKITKKAHAGRGQETKWEIPA